MMSFKKSILLALSLLVVAANINAAAAAAASRVTNRFVFTTYEDLIAHLDTVVTTNPDWLHQEIVNYGCNNTNAATLLSAEDFRRFLQHIRQLRPDTREQAVARPLSPTLSATPVPSRRFGDITAAEAGAALLGDGAARAAAVGTPAVHAVAGAPVAPVVNPAAAAVEGRNAVLAVAATYPVLPFLDKAIADLSKDEDINAQVASARLGNHGQAATMQTLMITQKIMNNPEIMCQIPKWITVSFYVENALKTAAAIPVVPAAAPALPAQPLVAVNPAAPAAIASSVSTAAGAPVPAVVNPVAAVGGAGAAHSPACSALGSAIHHAAAPAPAAPVGEGRPLSPVLPVALPAPSAAVPRAAPAPAPVVPAVVSPALGDGAAHAVDAALPAVARPVAPAAQGPVPAPARRNRTQEAENTLTAGFMTAVRSAMNHKVTTGASVATLVSLAATGARLKVMFNAATPTVKAAGFKAFATAELKKVFARDPKADKYVTAGVIATVASFVTTVGSLALHETGFGAHSWNATVGFAKRHVLPVRFGGVATPR